MLNYFKLKIFVFKSQNSLQDQVGAEQQDSSAPEAYGAAGSGKGTKY